MSHYGFVNRAGAGDPLGIGRGVLASDTAVLRYVMRGGRWVPKLRWRDRLWRLVLEWAAMTIAVWVMLLAGLAGGLWLARGRLDDESRAFADGAVRAVAAEWSPDPLARRAPPDPGLAERALWRAELGALKPYGPGAAQGCRGRVLINVLSPREMIRARYLCPVVVGDARALAVLSLKDEADDWKIDGFYVTPPRRPPPAAAAVRG